MNWGSTKALSHQQYMESGTWGHLIAPILIESNFVHYAQDYTHSSLCVGHGGGIVFLMSSLWQIKFLLSVQFLNFWLIEKQLTILEMIKKKQTWIGRCLRMVRGQNYGAQKRNPEGFMLSPGTFCTLQIKLSLGFFVLYRLYWYWPSWGTTGLSEYHSDITHNVYY